MYKIQFWKSWPTVYQYLFWIVALGFVASLVLTFISFYLNPSPVYGWEQLQELQQQPLPIHSFRVGGFEFTVFAENQILFERWTTQPLHLNLVALDVYLALFTLSMVILFSILTVIPRFWFFVGAGIAVFMISSFQLETLNLLGLQNRIPGIAVMTWLLGIALYYQYLRPAAPFLQRIIVFLAAALGIGFSIAVFSEESQPLRHFAISTMPAAIVLLMVFIIMVAHEIMAGFVSLVGQGTRNPKSLQHYLIISTIYLINLWIAYWNKIGWIDWGVVIPPVILLGVSGILAVWGIRQREPQYEHIVSADPFGVYFIGALGTIAFALIGYLFATANDISILSLNDIIIYTHIGYGMMFLMYMASNFLGMLSTNFPVQKVLYKPTVMPYFSYRMAGLIFTLAFLFYNSWMVPVNHFISGYYTSLGDLYAADQQTPLATGYYKRANIYAPYNQHASTALAQIEAAKENHLKQGNYLKDANSFRPTEFTLLNSANYYTSNKLEGILVLQEAHLKMPGSGVINNNLGIAYAQLGLIDSSYLYFSEAGKNQLTQASAEMNLLGLMAEHHLKVNADSIYRIFQSEQPRIKTNAIAIANRQGKQIDIPVELPKDSVLNLFSASLIANYLINHLSQTDTLFLSQCVALANLERNSGFRETILIPASKACYANGQVNRAFQLLEEVNTHGSSKGAHSTTLGLWSMEQGKPEVASYYFQSSLNQNSGQTALAHAVATAEMGDLNKALVAWDTLGKRADTVTQSLAESMKRVLAAPRSWFKDFSENEKYQYIRYRIPVEDSLQFDRCLAQITSEDLKAKAILDRAKTWFSLDEVERSARCYNKLQGLHLTDMNLFSDIKYFELRLLAAQGQWSSLNKQLQKGIVFGPYRETERVYYEALKQSETGDAVGATKNFRWMARNNYYFDVGIVSAAAFLSRSGASEIEIYSILAEALQVNPNSVRILKAYIQSATTRGFDMYASSALHRLQVLISASAFEQFVLKNQLSTLLLQ